VGQVVADAIVGATCGRLARLDIGYELLARGERNPAPEVSGMRRSKCLKEIGRDSIGDEREDGGLLDYGVEGGRKGGN